MDADKAIRLEIQPYLLDYHCIFEDICAFAAGGNLLASARLLILIADSDKSLPYIPNTIHLRETTVEYLAATARIQAVDTWVASDYVHSTRAYLRMGIDPVAWLYGRIDVLCRLSDTRETGA